MSSVCALSHRNNAVVAMRIAAGEMAAHRSLAKRCNSAPKSAVVFQLPCGSRLVRRMHINYNMLEVRSELAKELHCQPSRLSISADMGYGVELVPDSLVLAGLDLDRADYVLNLRRLDDHGDHHPFNVTSAGRQTFSLLEQSDAGRVVRSSLETDTGRTTMPSSLETNTGHFTKSSSLETDTGRTTTTSSLETNTGHFTKSSSLETDAGRSSASSLEELSDPGCVAKSSLVTHPGDATTFIDASLSMMTLNDEGSTTILPDCGDVDILSRFNCIHQHFQVPAELTAVIKGP